MKCILFAVFVLSAASVSAQQPTFKTDTTGEQLRKYLNIMGQHSLLPQSTYSHTTSKGKVYILPYDNMPCLVPDMKQVAPMPQYKMPEGMMPNIIPRQRLIPDDQKEKNKPR